MSLILAHGVIHLFFWAFFMMLHITFMCYKRYISNDPFLPPKDPRYKWYMLAHHILGKVGYYWINWSTKLAFPTQVVSILLRFVSPLELLGQREHRIRRLVERISADCTPKITFLPLTRWLGCVSFPPHFWWSSFPHSWVVSRTRRSTTGWRYGISTSVVCCWRGCCASR